MLDDEVSSNIVRPALEVMKDTTSRIRTQDTGKVVQIQLDQVEYLINNRNDFQGGRISLLAVRRTL